MSRKMSYVLAFLFVCSAFFAGCSPEADLSLKFQPDQVTTYKYVNQTSKGVDFIQPSLNKEDRKGTTSTSEFTFAQKVVDIDQEGNAILEIEIKGMKFYTKENKGVNFDFDSAREADMKRPLAKLIGKSYRIKVTPAGQVSVVDAAAARATVTAGSDANAARTILSDRLITERHRLSALPEAGMTKVSKGKEWIKAGTTPKGAMATRSYEKVYTVDSVKETDGKVLATVSMSGNPSGTKSGGGQMAAIGMLSDGFDVEEKYSGKLVFDAAAGEVVANSESFKSVTKAIEIKEPVDGKEVDPDVLTISFSSDTTLEIVD